MKESYLYWDASEWQDMELALHAILIYKTVFMNEESISKKKNSSLLWASGTLAGKWAKDSK